MANQIEKLNNIAITSIEKLNGLTDAQMEKVNGLEFTGVPPDVDASVISITNNQYESGDVNGAAFAYDEDNNVFGVTYGDGSNNLYPTVILGSISGTTITWGSEVVLESSAMSGTCGMAYDTGNNRFVCGTIEAGARNTPKVVGASVNTSGNPYIDNVSSIVTIHSPAASKSVGISPLGNYFIYDPAGSRTLAYFAKDGSVNAEDAVLCSITFDDVSTDNTVSASDLQVVEDGSASFRQDSNYCYDSTANKVVRVGQDKSGTYQLTAQVISGTGDTITVGSTDLYANASIAVHNENHGGSSLGRHRMDNNRRLCHANGVNHFLFWDDSVDDFVISNFSVSGTTATWQESSGSPVKSGGIVSEESGNLTQGKTSGWASNVFMTFGMGSSSTHNRLVVYGPAGTSASSDLNAQVVSYDGSSYTFEGSLFTAVSGSVYEQIDCTGWQSSDPATFLSGAVIGIGNPSDDSGGRIWAVNPGNT